MPPNRKFDIENEKIIEIKIEIKLIITSFESLVKYNKIKLHRKARVKIKKLNSFITFSLIYISDFIWPVI